MMTHNEIAGRLDEYLDGTLDAATRAEVEAHLVSCPVCRDELTALQSILAEARALPRSVMPAQDLWNDIEARLQRTAAPSGHAGRRWNLAVRYRVPLLAAAAVLLLLGGTLIGRYPQPVAPLTSTFAGEQQRYTEATAALARQFTHDYSSLPQETRAVVERNLAIVDAAIGEAEQALKTDPGNTALEQMVLARYQQRLALLKRATDAGRKAS
ncbi:MAG TPA: zf-HC2 domain-containing protein [Gemmatimonadales bacterium]|nr:zf-HC2 domain-containing protein [Gemmatimonadales bacterium]